MNNKKALMDILALSAAAYIAGKGATCISKKINFRAETANTDDSTSVEDLTITPATNNSQNTTNADTSDSTSSVTTTDASNVEADVDAPKEDSTVVATTIVDAADDIDDDLDDDLDDDSYAISNSKLEEALNAADTASNLNPNSTGPFEVPALEFDYDALEPILSEDAIRILHDDITTKYVNLLNSALAKHPELYDKTLTELLISPEQLPSDIQSDVLISASGLYNMSLLWKLLTPQESVDDDNSFFSTEQTQDFYQTIVRQFGSFKNLLNQLGAAGESVYGSGYVFLALNPSGKLMVITTSNQNTTLPLRMIPILLINVWEHVYFLDNQANVTDYLDNILNIINWERVADRFVAAINTLSTN